MSVLTKIFVVLVAVLSPLLVAFTIAYVNNTAHIKNDLDSAQAAQQVAAARANVAENALQRLQVGQASAITKLRDEKANLDSQIQSVTNDLVAAKKARVLAENDLAQANATISQLSSGQSQMTKINKDQADQIADLQQKLMATEKRFVEVSNELQEKTTTLATLTEQVRLIQEQLKDAQDELANRQEQQVAATTGGNTGAAPLPPAGVNINGQITAVQSVGDQTFVAINVGRQDNVAEGMHFIIHKGDQYIGSLTVTKVDLNSSAGRVTLKRGDITKNLDVMASAF